MLLKTTTPMKTNPSLNRSLTTLLCAATAAAALSVAHPAAADTITTFNVSGTCQPFDPFTGTTFGGTLTIDVTTGTVTAIDVSFEGLSAYNTIDFSFPYLTSEWHLQASNGGPNALSLFFTTGQTPPSLVGFMGGTIPMGDIHDENDNFAYIINSGSITAPAGVPDGGTTVMLLGAALGALGMTRRFLIA
jgi:hypothetical protein